MGMENQILKMHKITKRFPGVLALDEVDLTLHEGEVLAVVGENGAGKSTLLKVLSGAYKSDGGSMEYLGHEYESYAPREAIEMGISIIYQELDNFETLSVTENILVNALPRKNGRVDWKKANSMANEVLNQISSDVDVRATMSSLSTAQKQLVEIAKAMSKDMKVLVMDEPTSALNRVESTKLLDLVKRIAQTGVGVLYISHRLDEVFAVSDRIQVLRDGKSVAEYKTSDTNIDLVITDMVGRTLDEMYPHTEMEPGETLLNVKNLYAGTAKDISFSLRSREVLGLFGFVGAGMSDVARALFGELHVRQGEIELFGKRTVYSTPKGAVKCGVAYVPSERKIEGLMITHSVMFNVSISVIDRLRKLFMIDLGRENQMAKKWVEKLRIRTPGLKTPVESLSGGNQQKVVIAKWLETHPKILILDDPTRGVDVGAKVEIYNLMEEICEQGIGIIMISSEMQEMLAMSDRILVMSDGKLTGEILRKEATQEQLLRLAVEGG